MRTVILLTAVIVGAVGVAAQDTKSMPHHQMPAKAGASMTPGQKIANAMTAAPMSIADKATILDWPADENGQPSMLRTGTNGWTCLPDMPLLAAKVAKKR